jgi:RNA polymerase sigma-70 factor (ECF subfamily)
MVSLPELDSEIGVLRFLKWKTRLLALDVIRASGRAYINSIDDVQEPESNDPEVSSNLEQQDDAAVVRLALSKLNPRHREVLIASMYEEKSTEEIASQVGLSENATRQLIFRARAAFKKALIGDVDTTGMSAAAILSVAARKAASEGKKVGAAALTLIALVVMSLTVFPGLNRATTDQMAEAPVNPGSSSESGQSAGSNDSTGSQSGAATESATTDPTETAVTPETENSTEASQAAAKVAPSPTPSAQAEKEEVKAVLSSPALAGIYNSDSTSMVLSFDQDYTAIGDNGLIARFTFNPTSGSVFTDVRIEVEIDGYFFDFKPANTQVFSGKNGDSQEVFILVGDATSVYDEFGRTWSKSDLAKSRIKIEVVMADNGTTVKSIGLAMLGR